MYTRCSYVVLVCLLFSLTGTAAAQSDGADIQIRDGTIIATAADYEMDGTMWTAFTRLEDSSTYLYRSTDHGLGWEYRAALHSSGAVFDKIGLVVGQGESAFVHLFYLSPDNNGDLYELRGSLDGSSTLTFPVRTGSDTIRDFAVCRDYTGDNYWLYAALTNPDTITNSRALRFLRSTNYGRNWAVTDSYAVQERDPHLAAGPGSYIYYVSHSGWLGGSVHMWTNDLYLSAEHWNYALRSSDSDDIADPVIAPAFTMPESSATVWCAWSQNYQNSGNWDVKYCYSTDGGIVWSLPDYLAGSSAADEQYPDLRNYTSLGNQYINASYISDDNVFRTVYRRYAQASTPDQWSDTLRINEGSAGTGSEVRPKLCYTPGASFSGAGAVFVGAGLNGAWWNAPYPTGVAEQRSPSGAAARLSVQPSIGRGPFRVFCQKPTADLTVHDRSGRQVRTLALDPSGAATWDGTDERGRLLADGVYFCRFTAGDYRATEKMVLQK